MQSSTAPQDAAPRGTSTSNKWGPPNPPSGPPPAAQGPGYNGPPFPPPGQPRPFAPPPAFPFAMGQPGGRPFPNPPSAPGYGPVPRGPPPGPPPRGPPIASGAAPISRPPPPPPTYPPGTRPPPMMPPPAGGPPSGGQHMMAPVSGRQPPPPPPRLGLPGPPPRPMVGPPGAPPPRGPPRPPSALPSHNSAGPPGVSPPGVSDPQPPSQYPPGPPPPGQPSPGTGPPSGQPPAGIQVQAQGQGQMPAPSPTPLQQTTAPGQAAPAFGNFPPLQPPPMLGGPPLMLRPGAPPRFPVGPRMMAPVPVSQAGLLGSGSAPMPVSSSWPSYPPGTGPSAPATNAGPEAGSNAPPSSDTKADATGTADCKKPGDSPGRLVAPGTEPEVPGREGEGADAGKSEEEKDDKEQSENSEVDEAWTAHKSEDGVLYYYNSITAISTYDKPKCLKGKPEKVAAQPTPIAWERITGTDWALVTTDDGKKYYYNTKTQDTSWQIPSEVIAARQKQQEESLKAKNGPDTGASGKEGLSFSLAKGASGGASSALDLIKKKLGDAQTAASEGQDVENGGPQDGGAAEAVPSKEKEQEGGGSSDSDDESDDEVQESAEERAAAFKEMLKERGVAPFSKWEKELPRIFHDERFKAIASHMERKALFEQYVKKRADEQRKEKRAAQKAAVDNLKALLDEAADSIDHSTTPETFAKKWGTDSRYKALDRKERDLLLNERVVPLRKAEEERQKAQHEVAITEFKQLLTETSDIDGHSRWSKVKETLRDDPRFQALGRDYREDIFEAHVAALRVAEEEAERHAKIKREDDERQKAKEREARKRKEREQKEEERQKQKQRRLDATVAFQALLTEVVKDPQASWGEMKVELAKDLRGSSADLESEDCERMFLDHVDKLFETCSKEFRLLLSEVITADAVTSHRGKNVLNSWTEAKKLLKSDPRYDQMPRRQREELWVRHAEEVERKARPSGRDKDGNGHASKKSPSRRSPSRKASSRRSPSRRSPSRRSPQPSSRHGHRSRSISPSRRSPPPSSRHGHGSNRR